MAAILTMRSMARCRRNEKGQVTDAGSDLNQPDAFGELVFCRFWLWIVSVSCGVFVYI